MSRIYCQLKKSGYKTCVLCHIKKKSIKMYTYLLIDVFSQRNNRRIKQKPIRIATYSGREKLEVETNLLLMYYIL